MTLSGAHRVSALFGGWPYFSAFIDAGADGGAWIEVERWYDTANWPATWPQTVALAPTTYAGCMDCVLYREADLDAGTFYLAQAGTVVYASGGFDGGEGHFTGSATNLRLVEWTFVVDGGVLRDGGVIVLDEAVPGGDCKLIPQVTWSACWNVDGGGC